MALPTHEESRPFPFLQPRTSHPSHGVEGDIALDGYSMPWEVDSA